MQKTLMIKLIVVILVLMLSLSNILVLVSYAAEISKANKIDIDSQDSKTNNKNIEFSSYFEKENKKTYKTLLDIAEVNKVNVSLKVGNKGYLKTGLINFEEESFNIKHQEDLGEIIQNIDYDKKEIVLNQINAGTEIIFEIPIEMARNEVFNIQNLNKNNKVVFTGTYVTEKGKEISIEKEIVLNIEWRASADIVLEQNISKYIDVLENRTIVEIELNTGLLQNNMPVKEASIELDVPEIEGKLPKYANVVAEKMISTIGITNGLEFGENNFEYNQDEKKIKINVQNIVNENGEVSWKQGLDEYKIILVYENLSKEEKTITLNTITSFDVYGEDEKVEKRFTNEFAIKENIGNINEFNVYSENENIYKSFMYANSEYETEYKLNWNLDIGYANISDKIVLGDKEENFVNSDSSKTTVNNNTYYKQTIISKKNFEKILGNEGYIRILNEANVELAKMTLDIAEKDDIIINYTNDSVNKIKLELSKPQREGNLEIKHIKVIKAQTDFKKDLIKTFTKLENKINLNTVYNKVIDNAENKYEKIELVNLETTNSINLLEPQTKIEFATNKEVLLSNSINNDVELKVTLVNNKEEYSLFSNSVIDIKLPEEIEDVQIKDVRLVFEEELNVQNTELIEDENGIKHIRILLNGIQTKYNIGNIITGANLIIIGDIKVKEINETKQGEIVATCTNDDMESSAKEHINLVKLELPEEPEIQEPEKEEIKDTENEIKNPEIQEPEKEEIKDVEPEEKEPEQTLEPDIEETKKEESIKEDKGYIDITVFQKNENISYVEGDSITYYAYLKNNKNEDIKNINAKLNIPKGIKFEEVYISYFNIEKGEDEKNTEGISINEDNVEINIDLIASNKSKNLVFKFKIEEADKLENVNILEKLVVKHEEFTKEVTLINIKVDIPKLSVTQTRSILKDEVKENEIIKYIITVNNVGTCIARNVTITDYLPENVEYIKTETLANGVSKEYMNSVNGKTQINSSIGAGETFTTIITAKVTDTDSENINNIVKISVDGMKEEIETNNIINVVSNENNKEENNNQNNNNNSNSKKLYRITGQVWLDKNSNGIKDDEQYIRGVKVILINSNNQVYKTTTVNENGNYNFNDLEEGSYRVLFIYDTNKYGVTKYKASIQSNDSDAIEGKIQLDGKEQIAGITELIKVKSADVDNIDMGLIENPKFDLKLEKSISNIYVKTPKEEKTYSYENTKLAKVEFHAKEVDKSEIAITYKIKVINQGQIDGYATKIVDYMPQELEFDKNLNPNWYLGEDGNLYTNILENEKILPGETREVKLVLTKKMSGEETGLVNNKAEIVDSYNNYNLKDTDSTAGNNKTNEDDIDYADVYLGIKTGRVLLYSSLIISQAIVLIVGIYLIKKKVLEY